MKVVHCELICMYISMCPHVGDGCRLSYNLQYLLSTVHVLECAHVPQYGQFIES